jgi:hypothetical protein
MATAVTDSRKRVVLREECDVGSSVSTRRRAESGWKSGDAALHFEPKLLEKARGCFAGSHFLEGNFRMIVNELRDGAKLVSVSIDGIQNELATGVFHSVCPS